MGGGCSKKKPTGDDTSNLPNVNQRSLSEKIEQQLGLKIVLVGEMNTGKTSIVNRLVYNEFGLVRNTVGASFVPYKCQVGSRTLRMDIWDTAGSERYRSLAPMYYRQAVAALVVYDITSHATFEITEQWIDELVDREGPVIVALVGNKCDMEDKRVVRPDEAEDFVKKLRGRNIPAFTLECSAKSGVNVNEVFKEVGARLVERAGLEP